MIDEKLISHEEVPASREMVEEEEERQRAKMPLLAMERRLKGFDVAELGFTKSTATEEASRCLKCDLEED